MLPHTDIHSFIHIEKDHMRAMERTIRTETQASTHQVHTRATASVTHVLGVDCRFDDFR
jgi:hypothetical protein